MSSESDRGTHFIQARIDADAQLAFNAEILAFARNFNLPVDAARGTRSRNVSPIRETPVRVGRY